MEIIFYIIFSLVLLGLCGFVAYKTYKNIPKNVVSFRESLNLVDLPIITFTCGKKKLNLLLDSGATCCIIDAKVLQSINKDNYTISQNKTECFGVEGNKISADLITLNISYSGLIFNEEFIINDMSKAFQEVKNESGVTLHGIIGSNFFVKHKYILDFDKMIFYNKK